MAFEVDQIYFQFKNGKDIFAVNYAAKGTKNPGSQNRPEFSVTVTKNREVIGKWHTSRMVNKTNAISLINRSLKEH